MKLPRRQVLAGTAAMMAFPAQAGLRVFPQSFDQELPASVDVVIVGGGIVGVSTALLLANDGVSVAVCEKGFIGCEQSSRALGWVRVMGRPPQDIPLNLASRRLWQGMNQMIGRESGYRRSGIIYAYGAPEGLAAEEAWIA